MTNAQELQAEVERIERKLKGASLETRLAIQPSVRKIIDRMRCQGMHVPSRFKRLEAALIEDEIEARFDNMPI